MVFCESLNLIASFTVFYLLIDDNCEQPIKIVLLEHVMLVSHLSAHRAQCLKPLNCRCKHNKRIFFLKITLHFYNETIINLY